MKWCFLVNDVDLLAQFMGKIAACALNKGDEVIVLTNSKIAEFKHARHFPEQVRIFSKVDWCIAHYRKAEENSKYIDWKGFFPYVDRHASFLFSYQEAHDIVSQLSQWMESVFQKEKPDIVINQPPGDIFTEVAWAVCAKYSIPYLGFIGSKFQGRVDAYDAKDTYHAYATTFQQLASHTFTKKEEAFARTFLENFLSHKQLPPYQQYQVSPMSLSRRALRYMRAQYHAWGPIKRYLKKRHVFKRFDKESEIILRRFYTYPFDAVVRRIKKKWGSSAFDASNPHDKYYVFPLHVQPESSTSALATYFCDQVNTITNIAFALPFDTKLYVKEHPSALGHRPQDFYTRLRKLPNVVVIDARKNVAQLIHHSQGVITLTSTIGMEAALAGKPVYVLGNVFYIYHPLCKRIDSFENLRALLATAPIPMLQKKELEDANLRFIFSYFRNTIPGDVNEAVNPQDHNDYGAIYDCLTKLAGI